MSTNTLAHINPRHTLLNAGSSQAHQGEIIESGTSAGLELHQFNMEHYYVFQDILDSQTFSAPPTEPDSNL